MSEKATLLTAIPPVKKLESKDSALTLLSSKSSTSRNESNVSSLSTAPKSDAKVSLLSQTREAREAKPAAKSLAPTPPAVQTAPAVESQTMGTVASTAVAEEPNSITTFQFLTYASFVLNFLLAGAVAVILFKKAAKLAEERFVISAKTLAITSVLIMMHGFFATYLYASHLNNTISSAPLFLTMAIWVLVGPAVGFITRNLLARQDKPNRRAAIIDAGVYGVIFFLAACGVSSGIKTNAALLSSLVGGFLMIVPIARSMTAYKVAKARHKELNENADQVLIYGLLFIPALLPVLSFAHVCGLSDSLTLFLINFITFDFILVVALSMVASADEFVAEEPRPAVEPEPQPATPVEAVQTGALEEPMPDPVSEKAEESPIAEPKPEKVGAGNPDDPIIQFLNSEAGAEHKTSEPAKPTAKRASQVLPPRKPGQHGVTPPKKPGAAPSESSAAPNAPSRLKAPAKPKKRF